MVQEIATRLSLEHVTTKNGIDVLRELALNSFQRISTHQLPNGLIPASIGRADDRYFAGDMVWTKDHHRASRAPLDLLVQEHLPEISRKGRALYLKATIGMLRIQARPEQRARFASRPGIPDNEGYSTIEDRYTPAIKFTSEGFVYQDWGHNQPDNIGTQLLEIGRGIEADWPVLRKARDGFVPGDIIQDILSYAVHLRTERFKCRSIWEHDRVRPSYSTMRMVHAGISKIGEVWLDLTRDSKRNGYELKVSRDQIQEAAGHLIERVRGTDGDITDSAERHPSIADLASLVVLNDVDNLPPDEQKAILRRIQEAELENRLGFYRFHGDHWKHGRAEAKWTMGKPIMARYLFKQALAYYQAGQPDAGFRALDHGLDRINDLIDIIQRVGYIPELFEDQNKDGLYVPNNNELAWTHSYLIEAAAAGIAAIKTSERRPKAA